MTFDSRNTEIASTLAKLAALMAEDRKEDRESREASINHETPERVLLTVEETAELLNVGRTKAYALVRSGDISSVRIGRLRRVPKSAIDDYMERLINGHSNDQQAA